MKVLLIITNTHLWRSIGRAIAIWLLAGIGGGILLKLISGSGYGSENGYEPYLSQMLLFCGLGLVFSTPAIVIAIPVLFLAHRFGTTVDRIIFSAFAIITTSALLLIFYQTVFGLPTSELIKMIMPFTCSALGSYFLVMRKPITKSYPA